MSEFETDAEYDDDDLHEEEVPPDWVADEDLDLIDEDDNFYLDHKDSYEDEDDDLEE